MFWIISVYFNIRNTLPKSGTFLLAHPVYAFVGVLFTVVIVILNRCGNWSLILKEEQRLRVFQNKALKRIFAAEGV